VKKHGDSGGLVSGGNARLVNFAGAALTATGKAGGKELAAQLNESFEKSTAGAANKVAGQKLESTSVAKTATTKAVERPNRPPRPWWQSWPVAAAALFCILLIVGFARKAGAA
jgi:cobaltochelatase CobN